LYPRLPRGGRTTAALNPAGANTPSTLTILVDEDGGIDDVAADGASPTAEQRLVLQAVYDHFREHARWPTFITIDRPLRREHGLDTAAILLSPPDSLTVGPRPGGLRPIANDEGVREPPVMQVARPEIDKSLDSARYARTGWCRSYTSSCSARTAARARITQSRCRRTWADPNPCRRLGSS